MSSLSLLDTMLDIVMVPQLRILIMPKDCKVRLHPAPPVPSRVSSLP